MKRKFDQIQILPDRGRGRGRGDGIIGRRTNLEAAADVGVKLALEAVERGGEAAEEQKFLDGLVRELHRLHLAGSAGSDQLLQLLLVRRRIHSSVAIAIAIAIVIYCREQTLPHGRLLQGSFSLADSIQTLHRIGKPVQIFIFIFNPSMPAGGETG